MGAGGLGPALADHLADLFPGLFLGLHLLALDGLQGGVEGGLVALELLGLAADPEDLYRLDDIVLGDGVHHLLALDHLAEHGVAVVQVRGGHMGDEELAAVRARAGVGHGEHARPVVAERLVELVREGVAGSAGAGAQRATALDHEAADHPVEGQPVVERGAGGPVAAAQVQAALGQADEVDHGQRGLGVVEFEEDVSPVGHDFGVQSIFHFLFLGGFLFFGRECGLSATEQQGAKKQQGKASVHRQSPAVHFGVCWLVLPAGAAASGGAGQRLTYRAVARMSMKMAARRVP